MVRIFTQRAVETRTRCQQGGQERIRTGKGQGMDLRIIPDKSWAEQRAAKRDGEKSGDAKEERRDRAERGAGKSWRRKAPSRVTWGHRRRDFDVLESPGVK